MKHSYLPALLASGALMCSAQIAPIADPRLDSTGLPGYLKLLPQPITEPWRKITGKERFNHYASLTFSPFAGISASLGAAISQGMDSPHEWGQGWGPHGIRVASSYGGTLVGNTITYGMSAVFRDDNRYLRSRKDETKARLGAVLLSPYVAHNNSGEARFSTSSFLGGVAQATIPLEWSPRSWQGWNNVGVNYLIWYGESTGINFVREFYSNVVRYYKNRSQNKVPPVNAALKK